MSWAAHIDAPGGDVRLTRAGVGTGDVVAASPASLAEAAARVVGGSVSIEAYTLARVIASEQGSAAPIVLLTVGDCDLNRAEAQRVSLVAMVTAGSGFYGRQGSIGAGGRARPVATSRDPSVRHLRAARLLLSGEARGVALGARRYFDPKAQLSLWLKGDASNPMTVLERWTYNKEWGRRTRDADGRRVDTLGPARSGGEEWVGPIEGVNAYTHMMFRPSSDEQDARYEVARRVIETAGAEQPSPALFPSAVAALIVAAAVGAAGFGGLL